MEEGSKRRLVGTAVVVLLLVIFLPMLLEEEPTNPVSDFDLEIPPRPELDTGFEPSLEEPPAETFPLSATPELPQPDSYRPPVPEPEHRAQPIPAARPLAEPVSVPPASPAPPAFAPTPVAPPVVEVSPRPPRNRPSWVIQVSSLTQRPRALSLERELRAKGFPAFIEQAEVDGKTWHRVRVGPRTGRTEIEAMAASLRSKAGYEGQILRYP